MCNVKMAESYTFVILKKVTIFPGLDIELLPTHCGIMFTEGKIITGNIIISTKFNPAIFVKSAANFIIHETLRFYYVGSLTKRCRFLNLLLHIQFQKRTQ